MSFFYREKRALPINIDPYQLTARPLYQNYSGEVVSEDSAFASTALTSAVTIIADALATMPLELVRDRAGRWEKLPTPSLLQKPNDRQTMFEFVHQSVCSVGVHGVAFIYAPRTVGGLPLEMRLLHPDLVTIVRDEKSGEIVYSVKGKTFTPQEIKQIDWLCMPNQLRGISPLDVLRNTIGSNLAIDRFLSAFYGDGATPSSVLETDQNITPETAQIMRDTWEDQHYKRRRPAVLAGGLKWKPITASASDMDTMQHRESLIRDIARVYRIPLHLMLGTGGDNQTYQNIEQAGINFVRYTLLPWMHRLEDVFSDFLPRNQRVRFNAEEFLRADVHTRVAAQTEQIKNGTLTPNEAREIEGREPYEGGDQFIMALGTVTPPLGTDVLPPLGTDQERPR